MAYLPWRPWRAATLTLTMALLLHALDAACAVPAATPQGQDKILWKLTTDAVTAVNCYFTSENDGIVATEILNLDGCVAACVNNLPCTHFDWTKEATGRCQLKTGAVALHDAHFNIDLVRECGILLPGVRDRRSGCWGRAGRAVALFGCFAGGAIAASAVAGLLTWKARRKRSARAAVAVNGAGGTGHGPAAAPAAHPPAGANVAADSPSAAAAAAPPPASTTGAGAPSRATTMAAGMQAASAAVMAATAAVQAVQAAAAAEAGAGGGAAGGGAAGKGRASRAGGAAQGDLGAWLAAGTTAGAGAIE